jgi:hypothetical protein
MIAPASDELLTHHISVHRLGCPLEDWRARFCPCHTTIALVCTSCGEPVLLAADPERLCMHARELLGAGSVA